MGMRILNHDNLETRVVEGVKGSMQSLDVVGDESFGVGIRVIPAHSKVPKPGIPHHRGRRVLFVLRGTGTLTNGEYYEKLSAGQFAVLDDGEVPSFMTQDDELVVLEVRQDASGKIVPPTMATAVPILDARPPRATSYETVD